MDLELSGGGLLPAREIRLELLDYPGEWLLDLPLLDLSFEAWSATVLARLDHPAIAPVTRDFLAFVRALPTNTAADETLASSGHALYLATLKRLRDEHGLSLLQPGRFLMPAPGAQPPWTLFFPFAGEGPLTGLLRRRYEAYVGATRDALVSPLFGNVDRIIVLADLLGALHAGPEAFADARSALAAAAKALRWQSSWLSAIISLATLRLPARIVTRVAYAASKADHVSERQRGNLAALMSALTGQPDSRLTDTGSARTAGFAIAAARCTEDFVWALDGHPVSAVRGRLLGGEQLTRSYPGEIPDRPPGADFWAHPFLALPAFEPARLTTRSGAIPHIGLDALLGFLLEDLL